MIAVAAQGNAIWELGAEDLDDNDEPPWLMKRFERFIVTLVLLVGVSLVASSTNLKSN